MLDWYFHLTKKSNNLEVAYFLGATLYAQLVAICAGSPEFFRKWYGSRSRHRMCREAKLRRCRGQEAKTWGGRREWHSEPTTGLGSVVSSPAYLTSKSGFRSELVCLLRLKTGRHCRLRVVPPQKVVRLLPCLPNRIRRRCPRRRNGSYNSMTITVASRLALVTLD